MDIITSITTLATTLLNKIWGNKDEQLKQQFILELQAQLAQTDILKKQIEVNIAEASNTNRTWITWRELLGYILVLAVGYQWLVLPIISLIASLVGQPLDLSKVYTIEILDMVYLMCGMLGLDAAPIIAGKLRSVKK